MAVALHPSCYQVGREVIVKYPGEPHWHRRLLVQPSSPAMLAKSTGETHHGGPLWWICTRDRDIYVEELAVTPSIMGIRGCLLNGDPTDTHHQGNRQYLHRVLAFSCPRPAEFMDMISGVAKEEAAPLLPTVAPRPARASRSDEAGGGGAATPRGDGDGDDGLLLGQSSAKEKAEDDLDARVLSIVRTSGGERRRDFRGVGEDLTESTWNGWPLTGPRTVKWVVDYIGATDGNPRGRHTRWKRDANLTTGDAGVLPHEIALRALQFAVEFDQLNVSELSCMEFLARQAQLSELKHRERVLQADPSDDFGEDSYLYLGISQTRGQVMIMPQLEEFVSGQLEREGRVLKERRRLQEERKLVREPAHSGGGHQGGGQQNHAPGGGKKGK